MKLFWRISRLAGLPLVLAVVTVVMSGCYTYSDPLFSDNPAGPNTSGSATGREASFQVARFHIGDMVTVSLTGLPEMVEPHTEPIKEDGTITMPAIGHVPAAGKTAGELQNAIHDLYVPKYYRQVTVTVNSGDRVYFVTGEVKAPGRQLYSGQMTVTKAITTAGDFTDFANHKKVKLIRAGGQVITVNCDKALQDPSQDPLVYPNDQVQVPRKFF